MDAVLGVENFFRPSRQNGYLIVCPHRFRLLRLSVYEAEVRGIFAAGETMRQKCGLIFCVAGETMNEAEVCAGYFCGGRAEVRGILWRERQAKVRGIYLFCIFVAVAVDVTPDRRMG